MLTAGLAAFRVGGVAIGLLGRDQSEAHGLSGLTQQAALADRVFARAEPTGTVDIQRVRLDRKKAGQPIASPDPSAAGYRPMTGRMIPTGRGRPRFSPTSAATGASCRSSSNMTVGIDTDIPFREEQVGARNTAEIDRRVVIDYLESGINRREPDTIPTVALDRYADHNGPEGRLAASRMTCGGCRRCLHSPTLLVVTRSGYQVTKFYSSPPPCLLAW